MSGIMNPAPEQGKGKYAIVGGTTAVVLYRPYKHSAVAGDITASHADGIKRIIQATTDAEPASGIVYPMFGKEGLYEKDGNGDWTAPVGTPVIVFGPGDVVEAEIGGAINTGSDDFVVYLSPGANGLVKAVDTTGAKHFVCAQLEIKGVFAAGDMAPVRLISAQGPTAAA